MAYDTRRDKYLEIGLPFEPTEKTLIRAVGVPERLYYRLDVELGPGRRVFRLPLRDVVAAENILPEAFGVYGVRRLRAGQDAFLPVHAHPPGENRKQRSSLLFARVPTYRTCTGADMRRPCRLPLGRPL